MQREHLIKDAAGRCLENTSGGKGYFDGEGFFQLRVAEGICWKCCQRMDLIYGHANPVLLVLPTQFLRFIHMSREGKKATSEHL